MKNLDKYAASFAVLLLIVATVWLTKICDNSQKVTEVEVVDSLQYYRKRASELTKQTNEVQKEQTILDSLVIVAMLHPSDLQRAANRRSIIDSIRARRIRVSAGR